MRPWLSSPEMMNAGVRTVSLVARLEADEWAIAAVRRLSGVTLTEDEVNSVRMPRVLLLLHVFLAQGRAPCLATGRHRWARWGRRLDA